MHLYRGFAIGIIEAVAAHYRLELAEAESDFKKWITATRNDPLIARMREEEAKHLDMWIEKLAAARFKMSAANSALVSTRSRI